MNIEAVNLPILGREEISAVSSVLRGGALTSAANLGGSRVRSFESAVSSFTGSKYAVAVNSGTAALQAALYALGIGQGDEVLIPSFTFVATANAVMSVGARPVFVDIVRENYTMDPEDLERRITKKTRAIIPVHLYGNVAYVDRISEIAKKHAVYVIEDAAQSLGSTYGGRHTGTFFEMGCFSMYPSKVVTAGEGGVVVTNSREYRDRLLMIRNHGMTKGYDTSILGLNMRITEMGAAIATEQMKKLPKFLDTRKRNAILLTELLDKISGKDDDIISLPRPRKGENVNWYLYTIAARRRDLLHDRLSERSVGSAAYYSTPVHKTPFYARIASAGNSNSNLGPSQMRLTNTEWAASVVLSLPVHPGITIRDVKTVAGAVRDAF